MEFHVSRRTILSALRPLRTGSCKWRFAVQLTTDLGENPPDEGSLCADGNKRMLEGKAGVGFMFTLYLLCSWIKE